MCSLYSSYHRTATLITAATTHTTKSNTFDTELKSDSNINVQFQNKNLNTLSNIPEQMTTIRRSSSSSSQSLTTISSTSNFTRWYPVSLSLYDRQKGFSLAGGSFSIELANLDRSIFIVKGGVMSTKQTVYLLDSMKSPLYTISDTLVSARDRKLIWNASGERAFTLRRKSSDSRVIKVWRGYEKSEKQAEFKISGNFETKNYEIIAVDTGQVAASAKRRVLVKKNSNVFLEKHNYLFTVEAGYDVAEMTAIALAVDEQHPKW